MKPETMASVTKLIALVGGIVLLALQVSTEIAYGLIAFAIGLAIPSNFGGSKRAGS